MRTKSTGIPIERVKVTSPIHQTLIRSAPETRHLGVRHLCRQRVIFRPSHRI